MKPDKNTPDPSVDRQTIRHFWQVSLQEKRLLLLSAFIPISGVFNNTLVPLYIGKILASLGHGSDKPYEYILDLSIVAFIGVLTNFIGFRAFFTFQPKIMQRLETEALDTLLKRSVGFHNNRISGKLITDALDYTSAFSQLAAVTITSILSFLLSIVIGITIVMVNSWQLGLLILVMTVSVIAMTIRQTIIRTPQREQRHQARRNMVSHLSDTINNVQTVKTFASESQELKTHHGLENRLTNFRIRDWRQLAADGSIRIGVLLLFEIAFMIVIVKIVQRDPTLLGIGIFTFSYAINLGNRLFDIGSIFRTVEDALLQAGDMTRTIHSTPEVLDTPSAKQLKVSAGNISFNQVGFQYQDGSTDDSVFESLTLKIKPGEKIGLVGPSGGGKSTFTRLLLRFEDIQSGSITIDDQNIAEITQDSLRRAIAYVPQEPLLFHRTIRENITYGKPGATDKEVLAAARKAYAADFIRLLPQGFDTIVGERGVKLSGGQRQRIAIARAILKDAPLLVLDEATSALDSESEKLIQDALVELMKNRTTIVIAHRLSTIQKMDRIIVLDGGKITEEGSHKKLLKTKGLYAKLWTHQSGGFMED